MNYKNVIKSLIKKHPHTSQYSVARNMILVISLIIFIFIVMIFIIIIISIDMNRYSTLINDTGKIRGGIQRVIKLEIAHTRDDLAVSTIDILLANAKKTERSLFLKSDELAVYLSLVSLLDEKWNVVREQISQYRNGRLSAENLIRDSESIWSVSNEAVAAIEKTSHFSIMLYYIFSVIGIFGTISLIGILIMMKLYVRDRIEYLANHDRLTSAYNRYYFDNFFDREFLLSTRQERSFAIIMCDIDHFKSVNDRFGHGIGDEVLKAVAQIIRENSRSTDVVARFGGEEFILLAIGDSKSGYFTYAEKIRKAVEEAVFTDGLKVTISIGVSCYAQGMTKMQILEKADEALYQAKRNGRNQVVIQ